MYNKGIVVGEFRPLHKGHELLIQSALAECTEVMIISYTSVNYGFPVGLRERWLKEMFPSTRVVVKSSGMPDDDADGDLHRRFCCEIMEEQNFIDDVIFTSEDYGVGFAEFTSTYFEKIVSHVCVDEARKVVPISGTTLRSWPRESMMWQKYTSDVVRESPVRVMFIGPESSGKSTISTHLASVTGRPCIQEYGRTLFEQKGHLDLDDMVIIAKTQLQYEAEAIEAGHDLIFCDTSPLVTEFYSKEWYGPVHPELEKIAESKYDLILFCERDFGYIDDGTRNGVEFGDKQIRYYRQNLIQPYFELSGSIQEREKIVLKIIGETFPWVKL